MQPGGKRKDEDAETDASPFVGIRKNVVVREARQYFNEQQINPNKCALVLTKILYLLIQGETFTSEEATEVFFAVTKLFQSSDQHLRRMIYVVIKDLKIGSDESLIVVSCLSKDMTSKTDLFRANSIRVLAKIMDAPMVSQVERFLKQAIVDKNPFIVASTLCAGQHLFPLTPDVIKRWTNEVQEALQSKHKMVQYHALATLYKIKQQDKLALTKVVTALVRNPPQGPMAQCLQIRIIASLLEGSPNNPQPELFKFMIDSLQNKNFMVMYESARNICRMESLTAVQVAPAIGVLQEFLSSPIPAQRFAAVRTLSEVVVRFPLIVTPCSVDLEHLITDNNRSIATLAITTLLKTGVESNVDRLMKSISGFMSDISDEFKIVLVDAIKTLCLKFPHKHQTLMNFLASALREEGGYKYKKSIVESMLTIINEIKDTKDTGKDAMDSGLEHFCEFIEDCEFPELSVRILHLLGDKGPKTSNPAKYIRFIFNRVILETASVRSAAVSSLAKFGAAVPSLTPSCCVLLKRCLGDNDDEVRDRAIFHLDLLQNDREQANAMLFQRTPFVPFHQLEASLQHYIDKPPSEPFNVSRHLIDVKEVEEKKPEETNTFAKPAGSTTTAATPAAAASTNDLELFNSIPELKALGKVFKTCSPVELTETETEYVVTCIKHILPNHVVFQFHITNNMEDHQLENVTVEMESENEQWQEELSIPEEKIRSGTPGVAFVVFTRPQNAYQSGSLSCTLKFTVKEVNGDDVSATGSEDEYQLEEMEVTESDFMKPGEAVGLVEFRRQWEALGDTVEVVKKYSLGLDSLQSAVNAVIDLLGMNGVENSTIVPDNVRSHAVNLIGTFYGDVPVLCRAGFMLDANHGVTLKIAVRSQNAALNNMLTSAIR